MYVSAGDIPGLGSHPDDMKYVLIEGSDRGAPDFVFAVKVHKDVAPRTMAVNAMQRKCAKLSVSDVVEVQLWEPPEKIELAALRVEMDFTNPKKANERVEVDVTRLGDRFRRVYARHILSTEQQFPCDIEGTVFKMVVTSVELNADKAKAVVDGQLDLKEVVTKGMVGDSTKIFVDKPSGRNNIKLTNIPEGQAMTTRSNLFKGGFDFNKFGIGGLDTEAEQVFRRAFASRLFPPSYLEKLGITHVKGILLYGPPGCGKTLMARQIGNMLNCRKPKVVDGPSIMSKYVGQSEENIRKLFEEAEREQSAKGDDSELHLIIFDEFDAIVKQRGSTRDNTGVGDSVVNQLLAKIDGVDTLNNVLIVGMTNRKDLIDDALLRPGRFEVQIEVNLPDLHGRKQIFNIHTAKLKAEQLLDPDVDLDRIAELAKNYTGAEINGVVKAASSFPLRRMINPQTLQRVEGASPVVTMADFQEAMSDVSPAFGQAKDLSNYKRNGVFDYGPAWRQQLDACMNYVNPLKIGGGVQVVKVLLEGEIGTGKTALAAHMAEMSGFPFVKVVSMEDMIGFFENTRVNHIRKAFDDAHRSPYSVLILDGIERLIEYVPAGQRFSNVTLQALMVLIGKLPPEGRKLFIIGTTRHLAVLEELDLAQDFDVVHHVPTLTRGDIPAILRHMGLQWEDDDDEEQALGHGPERLSVKKVMLLGQTAQALAQGSEGIPELVDERDGKGKSMAAPVVKRNLLRSEHWEHALRDCGL